jgi:hypothetical protein
MSGSKETIRVFQGELDCNDNTMLALLVEFLAERDLGSDLGKFLEGIARQERCD